MVEYMLMHLLSLYNKTMIGFITLQEYLQVLYGIVMDKNLMCLCFGMIFMLPLQHGNLMIKVKQEKHGIYLMKVIL